MKKLKLILFFLFINFGCLALGIWLMGSGATSDWYISLNKAPWTPPGWFFGVAWTSIMICFSIYLAQVFSKQKSTRLKLAFTIQVFLNVIWNYLFFNQHLVLFGLINILALAVVIYYMFFGIKLNNKLVRYLLLPYMIWILVATSLNAYILIYN